MDITPRAGKPYQKPNTSFSETLIVTTEFKNYKKETDLDGPGLVLPVYITLLLEMT